ncbi:MAG: nitrogenase [Geminocystis sp.]|nr:nitrogenase [Geminocystis sp.]HIK38429.1 nitrogenase [Geminocystis sp. M7585_C2015_104]MCS7147774.1 nitrogenase [Geminocystis sp.]MCX8079206.1 nitrogenase [Geminocystis sp.]MDW8116652.1 Mo-dependent nitrogenase C-terminal domain-containing protein [Geminocystis sp.]
MASNTSETKHNYRDEQISAWLRGLLTVAYADGHFDAEEREFITGLTKNELAPNTRIDDLQPISPTSLAEALGDDMAVKENFLRTAVMVAIANGVYSKEESEIIQSFQEALGLRVEALKALEATLWHPGKQEEEKGGIDLLQPVKHWLDGIEIKDARLARFICKMIPSQCPFERDIVLFGRKIVHIPPMCKLNPLYEQLIALRFRALSFLADECKEDVTPYL